MSIEQTETIDFIGIDQKTNKVMLTISDQLDWEDVGTHLKMLQDKINCYLRFCESGEIYNAYPKAEGRKIVIDVVGKYSLNEKGKFFFERAFPLVEEAGLELRFTKLA